MMHKDKKKNYINEMKTFFSKTSSVFVTHYQGLTVNQIDELRSEMRKHGILFKITKNRITKLALEGSKFKKGVFPWAASGRSLSIGRSEGITKGLFDSETGKILGMGICGTNAGELISEASLAIEMGCDMSDIALTVHAHPTLSETTAFAAEMAEGTITDLMPKK